MAYAALVSLLRTLEESPQPMQQIPSDLLEKVHRLLGILDDPATKNNLSIRDLEGKIRDASFEAQDIIESLISTHQLELSKSVSSGVCSCFWDIISALHDLFPAIHLCETSTDSMYQGMNLEAKGLKRVIDELDFILEALSMINDGKEDAPGAGNSRAADSSRSVASNESLPVGLDEDLLHLKDRLTGLPSNLNIISIVGMGGIGKTTLARNLYNDRLIEDRFDTRAWVVVSQNYHVQELLTILVNSTRQDGGEVHKKSIEELAVRLHKNLKGRRYLIVMDDVWDVKAWDGVKRYFPDDNNSSRIILTTRQSEVAIYPNPQSPIHQMTLLSPKSSWDLLRVTIFGQDDCPYALEKIGWKIAENCKGLPLAIVVIGGLLSRDKKEEDWKRISRDVKSAIGRNDGDQFMQILSLSYNSLPHHLRACFLHMGLFPEDYEIFVSHLIKLWIAEGFIKPLPVESLEQLAKDYLSDLINRSLIEVRRRKHNGEIKTLIIHDMLRELCLKKAEDEKFLKIVNSDCHVFPQGRNNHRRVSVHNDSLHPITVHDQHHCSLLYFCDGHSNNRLVFLIVSFRMLKHSLVACINVQTLESSNFSCSSKGDWHVRSLQFISTIEHLDNAKLRHLLFDKGFLPSPFLAKAILKHLVVLENLQTLSGLKNFRCTKAVLEIMPNLKKLGIRYVYDGSTEWSAYEFNNFIHLHKLETLKCMFIAKDNVAREPLSLNLAFPLNLKKLTLSGCRISWEEMTVIGSLPELEELKLRDYAFEGSVWEPNEGEFTKLKYLLIDRNKLEHWYADYTHFPQLQHLCLNHCFELEAIPTEIGDIGNLEMIELFRCRSSVVASAMLIQEQQQSLGNEGLRVRVNSYRDYVDSLDSTSLRQRAYARGL
ncbi:putative late blight resistance proteinR1A-10 [Sesamum angolense]|uniref:Late blight resistance proteinR1A-10 n=1 Tax=Sesamum angolense TaxID=2727404 RepID=A0AAE1WZE2_9LAMI|nr:putative late blight resistance proteinR1A-10 [Sesamum angolense]